MTPYFFESKSKIPQFFWFTQVLEENFDDNILINILSDNFSQIQEKTWLEYWNKEGEELILHGWNTKYKSYLRDNNELKENVTISSELNNLNRIDSDTTQTAGNEKDTIPYHNNPVDEEQLYTWDDLWEEHRHNIYSEQYLIFSTVFYNYYLNLKDSLSNTLSKVDEETEQSDHKTEINNLELSKELEQLKLLGLPTCFAGNTHPPNNRSKKHRSVSFHYSDFLSDSEVEDYSGLEMEETAEDSFSLHKTENSAIAKSTKKVKNKNRKLKNVPAFMLQETGLLKYWRKRFSLFSRFDEGIRLDRESWFSVTPEKIARHLAERLNCSILVDGFCGSGGNAIQFAQTCDKVIAIDIDPIKLELAKHNAKIYNVDHKIEFILADFLQMVNSGKLVADIVFLSPPWGGPKYKNKKEYDIEKYLLPVTATELIAASRLISTNVALFLPRNANIKQIVRLAGEGNRCEIEHNYLDSRLVAITALYGEEILIKKTATI